MVAEMAVELAVRWEEHLVARMAALMAAKLVPPMAGWSVQSTVELSAEH